MSVDYTEIWNNWSQPVALKLCTSDILVLVSLLAFFRDWCCTKFASFSIGTLLRLRTMKRKWGGKSYCFLLENFLTLHVRLRTESYGKGVQTNYKSVLVRQKNFIAHHVFAQFNGSALASYCDIVYVRNGKQTKLHTMPQVNGRCTIFFTLFCFFRAGDLRCVWFWMHFDL